ncbi:Fatty acid synthase [Eumeta japonica]|uniref:Fatty acid synthase n=1 Tax=Eumeta variegata TaxID=151549 RepID=A0A4C1SZE5_EUMVA|nr:Fatty acid synthase [Eumeta japonica]
MYINATNNLQVTVSENLAVRTLMKFYPRRNNPAAYSRGLVSVETPFVRGAMAAVGLGQKAARGEISARLMWPLRVTTVRIHALYLGPQNHCAFVSDLRARGIFAKEVPVRISLITLIYRSSSLNVAASGGYQHRFHKITGVNLQLFSSAEYHTNNLLRPVLFEETARLLPRDAMLVEIAPHGLLQAILRRSMPKSTSADISPGWRCCTRPSNSRFDGHAFVVTSDGVDARRVWPLAKYTPAIRIWSYERKFVISLHDEEYQHLVDRRVYGVPRFSAAGLLLLCGRRTPWRSSGRVRCGVPQGEVGGDEPQVHEDRRCDCTSPFSAAADILRSMYIFTVKHALTGLIFLEVSERNVYRPSQNENSLLACGVITKRNIPVVTANETSTDLVDDKVLQLNANDIYRLLEERGYSLRLDDLPRRRSAAALLQRPHDGVSRPVSLLFLGINPEAYSKPDVVRAQLSRINLHAEASPSRRSLEDRPWLAITDLTLNSLVFMPHFPNHEMNVSKKLALDKYRLKLGLVRMTLNSMSTGAHRKAIQNLRAVRCSQRFDFVPAARKNIGPYLLLVQELNSQVLNALPAGSFALGINSNNVRVDWEKSDCALVSCARTTVGEIQLVRRRESLEHPSKVLRVSFDECMRILKNDIGSERLKRPLIVSELSASEKLPELVKVSTRRDVCVCLTDYQSLSESSIIMQSRKQLKINILKTMRPNERNFLSRESQNFGRRNSTAFSFIEKQTHFIALFYETE